MAIAWSLGLLVVLAALVAPIVRSMRWKPRLVLEYSRGSGTPRTVWRIRGDHYVAVGRFTVTVMKSDELGSVLVHDRIVVANNSTHAEAIASAADRIRRESQAPKRRRAS